MRVKHFRSVGVVSWFADFFKKQFDRQLAHPAPGLADCGDRDAALGGEVIVVVAHDQQLIWDRNAEIGGCLNDADR